MNEKTILKIFKDQMLKRGLMRDSLKLSTSEIYALLNSTAPARQQQLIYQLIENCIQKGYLETAKHSNLTFSNDNLYVITVLGLIKLDEDQFIQ
ncbi:TPA: hypothetical protein ACWM1T_001837 [Legionella pneumophila]|nr:hypothetical protein [Legionella pneumophila]HBD7283593.1 hypothetical protein [Legionella pneumophila]HBD9439254.1 hypothetical protein [Legionella pneumophila]HEN8241111.1 hypothetical protein [Legionella pneumophila]